MAMLEKHRNALDNHFAPQLGEEVTQALMANFPSRDVEEPVTKHDLELAMTARKADLATAVGDFRVEIAGQRTELKGEIAGVRTELQHALNRQLVLFTSLLTVAVGILLRAG